MSAQHNGNARRRRWRFGILRDVGGAAAVEFAIVVTPFLALVVGIIEIGADHYIFSQIDHATQKSVQEIRAGNVQIQKLTRNAFRDTVFCPKVALVDCSKAIINVTVVRNKDNWGAFGVNSVNAAAAKWCTGAPRDIVLVQIAYPVPLASMIWAGDKSNVDGQKYYLTSAAFRNEPFAFANPPAAGCA